MTKLEALAKDCIENHTHRLIDRSSKQDIYTREESIYISGYKECERQNKNKIAELEQKLEQTEKDLTDYQFNYPKIKDLEKENAELKKFKQDCETSICRANCQYTYEQLTKAIELLKRSYENYIYLEPIRSEIEQFLKEYEDYTHFLKTVEIEVPCQEGEDWHVCGEEYQEQEIKENEQ